MENFTHYYTRKEKMSNQLKTKHKTKTLPVKVFTENKK